MNTLERFDSGKDLIDLNCKKFFDIERNDLQYKVLEKYYDTLSNDPKTVVWFYYPSCPAKSLFLKQDNKDQKEQLAKCEEIQERINKYFSTHHYSKNSNQNIINSNMNKIKENYKFEITNLIGTNLVSSTWILVCRGKILKNYRFFKYFEQKFEIKSQFGGFFIKNDFFTFLDYEHQGKEDFEKKSNIIYASKNNNSKNLDIHNNENILQNNNLKKEDNKINFLNADERNLECVEDRSSSTIFSASENLNITSVKNKNNFEQLSSESLQEESKKKIDLVGVAENFASFSTYKISDENTTVDNENIYYTSGNYNNTLINNKFPQQQRFQRSPLTLNSGSNVLEILDENTIFLKNIPNGTTLQDLQSVFKKIGLIKDIRIKEEKKIAFVEFIDKNSVSNCKGKRVYSENGIVYFPEECRRKVK